MPSSSSTASKGSKQAKGRPKRAPAPGADRRIERVVRGESPLYIRLFIAILRIWFHIYDLLNYWPYQWFNSPAKKLAKSGRIKARPINGPDGIWRHVDGPLSADFPGLNTIDKVWRHLVELWGEKDCLGTRQLLHVYQERQADGRTFEKWELGQYFWQSYDEVEHRVGLIAAGLAQISWAHNKNPGDTKAVIYSETRADWLITALACFRAKIPVVTVYATLGEEAIAQAINETEASILILSSELVPKTEKLNEKCQSLRSLVYLPRVDGHQPDSAVLERMKKRFANVMQLNELQALATAPYAGPLPKSDEVALIMYTSGTTGQPKGVIITHANVVAAIVGQGHGVAIINEKDTYIGYLPLAHILELDAELTCLVRGCRVGYSSPLTLHDRGTKIQKGTRGDCGALKPTLLAAVPAIMDRIFKAVSEEVASQPRFMQELFKLNYERKRARYQEGYCSPFLDRIIFKKIRRLLGGKLRGVLSGGAALSPETQRFMNICFCCPVVQGYGLTETTGAACVAEVSDLSTGTVGPPVRCSDIVLREWREGGYSPHNSPRPQGEILIGGSNITSGYWKQPEKTAEDFIEIEGRRYFASGDIGEIREDGSLLIIDRKKDLVKLQHGEYVSLAKIETALLTCPLVDNICVYGDSLEAFTIALVVPNQKHLEKLAEGLGVTGDMLILCANSTVVAEYKKRLDQHAANSGLSKSDLPAKLHLCPEPWTSEEGLLTEALKLKRRPIQFKFQSVINHLYGRPVDDDEESTTEE